MFEVGDKIKVVKKIAVSYWISESMDSAVGMVGTVKAISPSRRAASLLMPEVFQNSFAFPFEALEKVEEPEIEEKPMQAFKVGDKVKVLREGDSACWTHSMTSTIGEIGTIVRLHGSEHCKFECCEIRDGVKCMSLEMPSLKHGPYIYPVTVLEKVEEPVNSPEVEFKFGDYVRVTSALNNIPVVSPELYNWIGHGMQVKYSIDLKIDGHHQSEVFVYDNGYIWSGKYLEKISKDEYLSDPHPRTVKDMVDNITRPNSKTPDASSKSSVEILSYPYAESNTKKAGWIDPIIHNNHDWADPTVHKFTVSGVFEFINGDKIIVPPPKGQWKELRSTSYNWPHHYVSWVNKNEGYSIFNVKSFGVGSQFCVVLHAEGRIVFDEYLERMKSEPLRVVELTEWQKLK
jgi:hypothetical protein